MVKVVIFAVNFDFDSAKFWIVNLSFIFLKTAAVLGNSSFEILNNY